MDIDQKTDRKLGIKTTGRIDAFRDVHHSAYEPTPYRVLEALIESKIIDKSDSLVDYGCGKGRVVLYLAQRLGINAVGLELSSEICALAEGNLKVMHLNDQVCFLNMKAEDYAPASETVFYFFNPFSVNILKSVIGKIRKSIEDNPREIKMLFYYPSLEFVGYLTSEPAIDFVDEIDLSEIYKNGDLRECIMIFTINKDIGI